LVPPFEQLFYFKLLVQSLQPPTVTFAVPVEEKVIQPGG